MSNEQLYLAIGVPILFNAALTGMLVAFIQAKFAAIDQRFVDMEKMWRGELNRVEVIVDARLKRMEEKVG